MEALMGARHLNWVVTFTTPDGELWFRLKSGSWVRHGWKGGIEGAGGRLAYVELHRPAWRVERDARRYTKSAAHKAAKNLARHLEQLVTLGYAQNPGVLARGEALAAVNVRTLRAVEVDAGVGVLADLACVE